MIDESKRHRLVVRLVGVLAAIVVLLEVAPARSQEQVGERRIVFVDVRDRDGNHVSGLSASNFSGKFRGQPVTILAATEDATSRRVAVVVDVSASRQEHAVLGWAFAEELVNTLVPQHAVAVFTLAQTLERRVDFTNDREVLQRVMRDARARRPAGASALYDGVILLARAFPAPSLGDVICLLSDGEDTSSLGTRDAMVDASTLKGIRMFIVGTLADGSTRSFRMEAEWHAITEDTGGLAFWIRPSEKVGDAIRREVCSSITHAYRLDVRLPRGVDRPRNWTLEVTGGGGLTNLRLVYPHRLAPLGRIP